MSMEGRLVAQAPVAAQALVQEMAQAQVQAPVWLLEMEQTMPDPGQEAVYMIEVEVMLMAAMLLNG